jgi:deoxycytidylate deaminase
LQATCLQARCGSVIVANGKVIGTGYNSPPNNDEGQRVCGQAYDRAKKPKTDLTCCVHAEWRAIIQAFKENANLLQGSTLYFSRVDEQGNAIPSGKPYCTFCSRLALDADIHTFVLAHEDSIVAYPTRQYNKLSYEYHEVAA